MKVSIDTPDHFVIDHFPWRVVWVHIMFFAIFGTPGIFLILGGAFEMGLTFILGSLAFPAILGVWMWERSQLVFDRPSGTAEIRRRNLRAYTRLPLKLANVEKLSTPDKTSDHRGHLYLHIAGGMDASTRQINVVRARWSRLNDAAERGNAWLTAK